MAGYVLEKKINVTDYNIIVTSINYLGVYPKRHVLFLYTTPTQQYQQ